jgi:hypothetical protein
MTIPRVETSTCLSAPRSHRVKLSAFQTPTVTITFRIGGLGHTSDLSSWKLGVSMPRERAVAHIRLRRLPELSQRTGG